MANENDPSSTRSSRGRRKRPVAQAPATPAAPADPLLRIPLIQAIERERAQLLQAYSLLKCLYDTLLYADHPGAVLHADVANVTARLIEESVTRLDAVKLAPLIDALTRAARPNTTSVIDAEFPAGSADRPDHKVEDRGHSLPSRSYRVEETHYSRYLS